MLWNRLRIVGALSVFLLVNSCGGREQNPFERAFSIQSGDACFEVKQVVLIALNNHLSFTTSDLPSIYRRAISRSLSTIQNVSEVAGKQKAFQTQAQEILKSINGNETADLNSCQAMQRMDALISDLETRRLQGEWNDTGDGDWKRFMTSRSPQQIYRIFLNSFGFALDPFSHYQFNQPASGWNFGIRTNLETLLSYGRLDTEVSHLSVEGVDHFRSKAFSSGIQIGDKIIALKLPAKSLKVFNTSLNKNFSKGDWITIPDFFAASTASRLGKLFSKSPDEKIQAKILRKGKVLVLELIGMENEKFLDVETIVSSEWLDGVGYIRLFEFSGEANSQVARALGTLRLKAQREGATADFPLILDLRSNPGGQLFEALRIASQFVEQRLIGTMKHKEPESKNELITVPLYTKPVSDIFEGPVVILVNNLSASASELLALFLRDAGRAVVVGEDTFGKGIGQSPVPFGLFSSLGGTFSFTTEIIYGLSGQSPQWSKLQPDVLVHDLKISQMKAECQKDESRKCGVFSMQELYARLNELPPITESSIEADKTLSPKPYSETQLIEWQKLNSILLDGEDRQLAAAMQIVKGLDMNQSPITP